VLTFYGGEPLLKMNLIRRIMDDAPVLRFRVQTNGLLIDQLEPEYIKRFSTIFVSIDGWKGITDANRGVGTYRRVMKNIKKILDYGFTGEIIARMTVNEDTDIFDAVTYLADNPDNLFSSIHWQMDANFSDDFSYRRFSSWVREEYNPGIISLAKTWVKRIRKSGRVPRWYPFLDTMHDLLQKEQARCAVEPGTRTTVS
jgi:sulfatase maturation enzyme AslB (radical SAM superfamily)